MQFLQYYVPYFGGGFLIGINAIVHVLISHGFAIGAVGMVVLSEYLAYRNASEDWDRFARQLLKVSIIVVTSLGAVTGVGIWFTTSVLAPGGIGSLVRIFFWPWFVEWIVFTLEVVVILIYYFTWDKWDKAAKRRHVQLGALYIVLGFCSAMIICGILGFMLTPAEWPWAHGLQAAFFNPSFPPQFLLRVSAAFALGAIVAIAFLIVRRERSDFERAALRVFGRVLLVAVLAGGLCAWWYFQTVPERLRTFAAYSVLTSRWSQHPGALWAINALGTALLLLFALGAAGGSRRAARILVVPAIVAAVGLVGQFERIREFIRGPYLIPGYMYANQVLLSESACMQQEGSESGAYWREALGAERHAWWRGEFLFNRNCAACHTRDGVNGIAMRVRGRSRDGIFVILRHTEEMIPFMPPFSGTDAERRIVADYLYRLAQEPSDGSAPTAKGAVK